MKNLTALFGLLLLGLAAQPLQATRRFQRVGIMTATAIELKPLVKMTRPSREEFLAGRSFQIGQLEGTEVVLVEGGVGKVNATITATLLLTHYNVDLLFFSGVGGGLKEQFQIGDVVVSSRTVQGDYVKIAKGKAVPAPVKRLDVDGRHRSGFLTAPKELVEAALLAGGRSDLSKIFPLQSRKPKVFVGTICTQDSFVGEPRHQYWLRKTFDGAVSEMEGAAAAQAARSVNIPWLVFRGISDHTNGASTLLYPLSRGRAARNAALVLANTLFDLQGVSPGDKGWDLPVEDDGSEAGAAEGAQ
jgi:adenosylhomocysteine nucleosidase